MLCEHPQVFGTRPKELHYFSRREGYSERWAEYRKRFSGIRWRHRAAGEATPNYLWCSDHRGDEWSEHGYDATWRRGIPDRIAERLGTDLRLIVMLRDPVDRAISAFYHHLAADERIDPSRPFLENARRYGIVTMGFYAAHLERFLETFDPSDVLVLIQEEVRSHPAEALAAV